MGIYKTCFHYSLTTLLTSTMIRPTDLIAIICCTVLHLSCSKQKGCTDKGALNYSVVAEENDGSCKYCTENKDLTGYAEELLYDENFSSPYYGQAVVKFIVYQVSDKYNDQTCGNDVCHIDLDMINLVNKNIHFSYQLRLANGNIFSSGNINIPPKDTTSKPYTQTTSGPNSTICSSNVSSGNSYVETFSTITYD